VSAELSVADIVVVAILGRGLAYGIVTWDERRLERVAPHQLERAWPPASKGSAILQFGELALPVHFLRTRRSLVGLLWAVVAFSAVAVVEELALMLLDNFAPGRF